MFARLLTHAVALALAGAALGATPRITFSRTIPARHDIGPAESLAVIYALGDSDKIHTFLGVLIDQIGQSPTLHAVDATTRGPRFVGERPDRKTVAALHRDYPADVYLGIHVFTCSTQPGEAERGVRDLDGERVRRKQTWIDAVCTARVDVMRGKDLRRLFSYTVRGEGTSPRADQAGADEEEIALEQAARYAAVEAAELITPRVLRDSIALDARAPAFEEGMAMIEAQRYEDAREIWEEALEQHPRSAALHHNLAAVAEALGNRDKAVQHAAEAARLAPQESLYKVEWRRLRRP